MKALKEGLVNLCTVPMLGFDAGDYPFVVPKVGDDEESLLRALQGWIALNVSVVERPKSIQFRVCLPMTQLGKDADR